MRKISVLIALAFFAILLSLQGCAPSQELENENAALRISTDSLRHENFQCLKQNTQLSDRADSLQTEIMQLKESASKSLAQQKDEEASRKKMESRVSPVSVASTKEADYQHPVEASQSYQALYQNALYEFKMKNFTQSLSQFAELAKTLPVTDLTDNCEYWMGECHYALGRYTDAVNQFGNVFKYPGSDKTDDALLMRGNCFMKLQQNDKAKEEFKKLLEQFPDSEYAPRAREKVATIK